MPTLEMDYERWSAKGEWTWLSWKMEEVPQLIEKQTWPSPNADVEYQLRSHIPLYLLTSDFNLNARELNLSRNPPTVNPEDTWGFKFNQWITHYSGGGII